MHLRKKKCCSSFEVQKKKIIKPKCFLRLIKGPLLRSVHVVMHCFEWLRMILSVTKYTAFLQVADITSAEFVL